jgi:DNA-binding transcriptional MerR regulator
MIRIGDFSKLSRISIRMLRHYDELDLLKPENVDNFTGYRYYSPKQLQIANRITALKDMGFSLTSIKKVLKQYNDPDALITFLSIQLEESKQQELETKNKTLLIESAINRLRKDDNAMKYDVTLKTLPERLVVSLRKVIPSYACEGELWYQMNEETGNNIVASNPEYCLAIFHDTEYKNNDVDVEIQMCVQKAGEDTENVKYKTVELTQFASAIHKGNYDTIGEVNESVAMWVNDNGYDFNGSMFNIYHVSPGHDPNPENWVTEVCYPVKKK